MHCARHPRCRGEQDWKDGFVLLSSLTWDKVKDMDGNYSGYLRRLLKKSGYFTVRLTVSIDPPPLTVSFSCCCPPNDHLQESGPSGWSFARGWSLRIIICKRSAPPNDHLQEAGPSGSSCASSAFHQYMNHACCPGMWQWKSLCLQGDTSESFKNFLVVKTIDGRRICMFIFAPLLTLMTFLGDKKW